MEWLNSMKQQLPMDKIMQFKTAMRISFGKTTKKEYPDLSTAKKIIKRIDVLLSQQSIVNLGKQQIFSRDIVSPDGTKKLYAYMVDFDNTDHIKRLRTFLTELVDLCADDANEQKKQSIPQYLDYIVQTSL